MRRNSLIVAVAEVLALPVGRPLRSAAALSFAGEYCCRARAAARCADRVMAVAMMVLFLAAGIDRSL